MLHAFIALITLIAVGKFTLVILAVAVMVVVLPVGAFHSLFIKGKLAAAKDDAIAIVDTVETDAKAVVADTNTIASDAEQKVVAVAKEL